METLVPGERIDTYKITKILHDGEMALVYMALDLFSNETVVLKVPFDDIINRPILYYQYQNEEAIGRYLDHDRIVRFLRRDRSGMYLVMEFIDGENLRTLLNKKKKLPLANACSTLLEIAEGVQYLHENSIIHLDLKPDNIMVTPDNGIKILDFGLANHLDHNDLLARDLPGPKGTPYYIAPEQLCGRRNYKESDIYSLGVLFYEILTGQLPHGHSKKLSRVRDRIKRDPIPPRYYDREIPPSVQEIILKTLEKRPEERYRSITDFIVDLNNYSTLPTTVRGELVTKPLPLLWFFTFAGCSNIVDDSTRAQPVQKRGSRQILGCIIDHDYSDLVVEQVKREVLLRGGEITLLASTEETDDESLVKYAVKVEGKTFSKRLDKYVATLKRYDLDPILRIKRGDASEVIVETAHEIDADTIVLGPPRSPKGLTSIFGGSTIQKVIKQTSAKVIIADATSPASPPFFTHPNQLNPELLAEIDLFLTETWVQHLNWFSETSHGLLDCSLQHGQQDETTCHFGRWLTRLPKSSQWVELTANVAGPHKEFHRAVMEMTQMAEVKNLPAMITLYRQKALPLSTAFKEALQKISNQLRSHPGSTTGIQ
ncbi:MAG: protein kinase [Desulforhopalus sp.]